MRAFLAALLILHCFAGLSQAHELRPAYLSLQETSPGTFALLWRVPAMGDKRLSLDLRLPKGCAPRTPPRRSIEAEVYVERAEVFCTGGLPGGTISIDGLSATLTDALVRIAWLDSSTQVARLLPEAPSFEVLARPSGWQVAGTYLRLGFEHIYCGPDHLLFVAALVLLIRNRWMMAAAITAFTVAHSLTLVGAVLGYVSLPQQPVEAAIALSIAFLARELVLQKPGALRLSAQSPWLVAFAFGLLHGFGFAGGLRETGLPQTDVLVALLSFNLGVEAGQLAFIAVLVAGFWSVRRIAAFHLDRARLISAYAIGGLAITWVIERISVFTM